MKKWKNATTVNWAEELDLFSLHEDAGPGLVYWHPKGARIRLAIEDFWRKEHYKNGYEMVYTRRMWESPGCGKHRDILISTKRVCLIPWKWMRAITTQNR